MSDRMPDERFAELLSRVHAQPGGPTFELLTEASRAREAEAALRANLNSIADAEANALYAVLNGGGTPEQQIEALKAAVRDTQRRVDTAEKRVRELEAKDARVETKLVDVLRAAKAEKATLQTAHNRVADVWTRFDQDQATADDRLDALKHEHYAVRDVLSGDAAKATAKPSPGSAPADFIGFGVYGHINRCRHCKEVLIRANYRMADGCPCNAARGINHGLVPTQTCTCDKCDPAQTGGTRHSHPGPTAEKPPLAAVPTTHYGHPPDPIPLVVAAEDACPLDNADLTELKAGWSVDGNRVDTTEGLRKQRMALAWLVRQAKAQATVNKQLHLDMHYAITGDEMPNEMRARYGIEPKKEPANGAKA